MGSKQTIEELIVTLNDISYDDHDALDVFLGDVRGSLQAVFGPENPYLTYLGQILFSVPGSLCVEDKVRRWAKGKKELRDLLCVILETFSDGHDGASVPFEPGRRQKDLAAIMDTSLAAGLARVRIDLRDLFIMDQPASAYYARWCVGNRAVDKRVFFVPSSDEWLNNEVRQFLKRTDACYLEVDNSSTAAEMLRRKDQAAAIIVGLSGDHRARYTGRKESSEHILPSPSSSFDLGFIVGVFGRQRVISVYRETPGFRRPEGIFDVFYIALDASGAWGDDLAMRLKICGVNVVNSFFQRKETAVVQLS